MLESAVVYISFRCNYSYVFQPMDVDVFHVNVQYCIMEENIDKQGKLDLISEYPPSPPTNHT